VIQQGDLIDEDAFDLLVEVLDSCVTQFVEDATHLFTVVGVGIGPYCGTARKRSKDYQA
jgi:hypothetical protein